MALAHCQPHADWAMVGKLRGREQPVAPVVAGPDGDQHRARGSDPLGQLRDGSGGAAHEVDVGLGVEDPLLGVAHLLRSDDPPHDSHTTIVVAKPPS